MLRRIGATVLIVAAACSGSDSAATEPRTARIAAMPSSLATRGGVPRYGASAEPHPVRCAPHAPILARGVFGPSGGELLIGESRLIIPGGALLDTVTISGTAVGDSSSTIEFAPHGLLFRKPAQLVLSGDGCALPTEGDARIVYLGPSGEILETIEAAYLPRWKLVAAPINHFSGYAILF
jgi:hypothetical protein